MDYDKVFFQLIILKVLVFKYGLKLLQRAFHIFPFNVKSIPNHKIRLLMHTIRQGHGLIYLVRSLTSNSEAKNISDFGVRTRIHSSRKSEIKLFDVFISRNNLRSSSSASLVFKSKDARHTCRNVQIFIKINNIAGRSKTKL